MAACRLEERLGAASSAGGRHSQTLNSSEKDKKIVDSGEGTGYFGDTDLCQNVA